MDEFVQVVMSNVTDVTLLSEFTVMVRILCFCIVIEGIGVTIGHISSLGR